MTKYRFELCEVTHRTGLRLMHPAVALVLQAWGEELVRDMTLLDQHNRTLLKKLNRVMEPDDPGLQLVNTRFAEYSTVGGDCPGARECLIHLIQAFAKEHGIT